MSHWSYILVFNEKFAARGDVGQFLSQVDEVNYWYACLPNCIFLTSSLTAGDLAEKLRVQFGEGAGKRFLISEIHEDRQGWLPKQAWNMFKNPENPRL